MNTSYLDPKFIMAYTKKQPKWGFNGLGYLVAKRTYCREVENENRTEEWWEVVQRCVNGTVDLGVDYTKEELERLYDYIFNLKGSFAGRMLWQLGTELPKLIGMNSYLNCWTVNIQTPEDIVFVLENLMLGGGVGFSVQRKDVYKFPLVKENVEIKHLKTYDADYIVPDKREGWADLFRKLFDSFFNSGKSFTYSTMCVRGKDEPIKTFGGKASGPGILIEGVELISKVLQSREGKQLRSIDVLDIVDIIGQIVKSGNVRRSALLALGDPDDVLFLEAKRWDLGSTPSWRAFSNNTIAADSFEQISDKFWEGYYGNGEPYGLFNVKNAKKFGRMGEIRWDRSVAGINPCGEITLGNHECCNLSELYLPKIDSYEEFIDLAKLLYKTQKTIAAGNYLHEQTNEIVHKNMRLGLSISGYMQS